MPDLRQIFDKNLAAFLARHTVLGKPDFSALWDSLNAAEIAALKEGVEHGRWLYKEKLLHSERNPEREAARAAEVYSDAQALICISAGAGFLLASLVPQLRKVLLIEPAPFCFAAFILSGVFQKFHGEIALFADPLARADALEEILPWLQGKNLKRTLIYCHGPLMQIEKAAMTRAYERVVQLFEKRSVNQATIVKFQQLWNKNIFLNQRAILQSGKMKSLTELHPPDAIVLAGAGPSLADSLPELMKNRGRCILFAADTALIPLTKAGIFPDFVFSADPQWLNHYFAQTSAASESVWVMDPVVCPAIPRYVQSAGVRTLFWNNVFLADTQFRTEDRGDVAHGGSVSTNAFDIAVRWLTRRADDAPPAKIILIGQDLSFSNRQAHTKGAVLEAQVYAHSTRLRSMEQHNFRQMTAMPVIWQKGIRQPKVRTNGKLQIFHDWFEARAAECDKKKITLVNATFDGAHLNGFEHLPLAEALAGVPQQQTGILPDAAQKPGGKAGVFLEQLARIEKLMAENTRLAAQKNADAATVQKLNQNDAEFRDFGAAKDIVGLNAQALILKITEQGEEADAVAFYRAMARGARSVRHWASKAF